MRLSNSETKTSGASTETVGTSNVKRSAPTHIVADQEEVFHFLQTPSTYPGNPPVQRIDTHGAAVFLAGPRAYKVKRAVRFPFMDLSTLEKRRQACEAEVRVNRNNAPGIYEGVVPIVRRAGLKLGGLGDTVEWAVQMRRFDETMTLDRVAERGELTSNLVRQIARAVAQSHARAPSRSEVDAFGAMHGLIAENGESLAEAPGIFPGDRVTALTRRSLDALVSSRALIDERVKAGRVRRCHGDLHLRNLVLIDGRPTLFDALEFDEALATIDELYDLAFLIMDLWSRGLHEEANLLLNRYLVEYAEATLEGLALLPLFISVRAAIRAKVTSANLQNIEDTKRSDARTAAITYFRLAEAALEPAPATLVAVAGLSGTGKSALAARLAPEIGRIPGAVHLRSDVERKRLRNVPELQRLPATAYTSASTAMVYRRLAEKAESALRAGQAVVVDAVHSRAAERFAIEDLARRVGVRFVGLWLEAPLSVRLSRVKAREGDASDADSKVVELQAQADPGVLTWRVLDASGDRETVLNGARHALGLRKWDELHPS
jgi:aminoglycoside phosphotransferase family enzyme/predicted kinase